MVTEVTFRGNGRTKKIVYEELSDTDLMLWFPKSAFTILRSHYSDKDGRTVYEYWIKNCPYYYGHRTLNKNWQSRLGVRSKGNCVYSAMGDATYRTYPVRPDHAPKKIVFDSGKTAYVDDLTSSSYETYHDIRGCWTYIGSSEDGILGGERGSCDIYGYLTYYEFYVTWFIGEGESYKEKDIRSVCLPGMMVGSKSLNKDELMSMTDSAGAEQYAKSHSWYVRDSLKFVVEHSGIVGRVSNWEVVSNSTPEKNTYYIVVLDEDGELVDVFTTQQFGIKVGQVIGDLASRFSDEQNAVPVKDDMTIRIGMDKIRLK